MFEKECNDSSTCEQNKKKMAQVLRILANDYPNNIHCRKKNPKSDLDQSSQLAVTLTGPIQPPPIL